MVLLLGGKRVAWLMMLFSGIFYLIYLMFITKSLSFKRFVPYAAVFLAVLSVLILSHSPLKNRVISTAGIFSGDANIIELSTARRLSLWQVSIDIFRDNPVNGVGPRGYREVFTKYANVDNFWMQNDRHGTTHPHMMLAEIASETGLLGLVGLLVFYYFLFSRIFYLIRKKRLEIICSAGGRILSPVSARRPPTWRWTISASPSKSCVITASTSFSCDAPVPSAHARAPVPRGNPRDSQAP